MTTRFELRGVCPLLQVFDMPASLAFYRDLLGFEVIQAAPASAQADAFGWVWLQRDGTEIMLNSAYDPDDDERPSRPDAPRVAAHGDTVLYFGCPDVGAAHRYLRARGFAVSAPVVTSYGMEQLTFNDPDGFVLCFQWRAAANAGPVDG